VLKGAREGEMVGSPSMGNFKPLPPRGMMTIPQAETTGTVRRKNDRLDPIFS